jgi:glycosyltransferase involved in cell wall biosynthesis
LEVESIGNAIGERIRLLQGFSFVNFQGRRMDPSRRGSVAQKIRQEVGLRMKIMEIVSGGDINGAVVHCALVCRELARRGHEVTLVCKPHAWIAQRLADEPVRVLYSDLHRWPMDELGRIAAEARASGVDVIHTHMSRAHAFGVLLRLRTTIPCVATAHNRYVQLHWMFNDFVIGTSAATTRFHRRYNFVRKRASETIHNFIDEEAVARVPHGTRTRLRSSFGANEGHVLIGQIGDIIPRKGLLHLVRALPAILARQANARLIVVGDVKNSAPYLAQIKTEARALGVADAIHWAGHRRDIPDILSALDIVALASLEESLPLSILEAMASCKPVVATSVGGLPECIAAGENGVLVRPGRPDALADAVGHLASDAALRRQMGERGRERIAAEFSVGAITARIERVFEQVVRRRAKVQAA